VKVLWVGDAVVSTGFSRCTHAACDSLFLAGHEPHVLGINFHGDPTDYSYKVYPAIQPFDHGKDAFGVNRLPFLVDRIRPDVICLLNDPWNAPAYTAILDSYFKDEPSIIPPVCAWLAVDAKNIHGRPLNRLDHVMVWTKFAENELRVGGYEGSMSIVPLGVDHGTFYPRDKVESRKVVFEALSQPLPDNAFIVGVVGRLQLRKRVDLAIQAFAYWIKRFNVPNSYLYLHLAPTGDTGCNIRSLTRYYGIEGRVLISEPHIGHGVEEAVLPFIYSSFDISLTATQGEGWGLCQLESLACGVPVIAPDWSALGKDGWGGDAIFRIPCNSTALTAPMNSLAYTIGGVPDCEKIVQALDTFYVSSAARDLYRQRGLACAAQFSWQRTGAMVVSELEGVVERHRASLAASSTDRPEVVDSPPIEALDPVEALTLEALQAQQQ
jgi:glycosyltransferase involved in cell wall biosynthesis